MKLTFNTKCVGVGSGHGVGKIGVEIKLEDKQCKMNDTMEIETVPTLSIVGYTKGCCGQCWEEILNNSKFVVPVDDITKLNRIIEIWKEYHLNDLTAGTERQEEFIKKNYVGRFEYIKVCELLKENNLYVDNGYKYGTAWLCKRIPNEIVEEIKEMIA